MDLEQALAKAQEKALERQSELAQITPAAPQPVATPKPRPAEGQTVITFAPHSNSDLSLYDELAASFRESRPDLWVEVIPPAGGLTQGLQ